MGSGAMRRHSVFLIAVLAMFTICRQPTLTGWDDAFYVAQLTSALGEAAAATAATGWASRPILWPRCAPCSKATAPGSNASPLTSAPPVRRVTNCSRHSAAACALQRIERCGAQGGRS